MKVIDSRILWCCDLYLWVINLEPLFKWTCFNGDRTLIILMGQKFNFHIMASPLGSSRLSFSIIKAGNIAVEAVAISSFAWRV